MMTEAEVATMQQTYTAVVKHDEVVWIGWIAEIPGVNCQEATRDALLASLRATSTEAVEFNRADARDAAGRDYEELPVAVWSDETRSRIFDPIADGCCVKAAIIRGGNKKNPAGSVQCHATVKSTIIAHAKSVATSVYPKRRDPDHLLGQATRR